MNILCLRRFIGMIGSSGRLAFIWLDAQNLSNRGPNWIQGFCLSAQGQANAKPGGGFVPFRLAQQIVAPHFFTPDNNLSAFRILYFLSTKTTYLFVYQYYIPILLKISRLNTQNKSEIIWILIPNNSIYLMCYDSTTGKKQATLFGTNI